MNQAMTKTLTHTRMIFFCWQAPSDLSKTNINQMKNQILIKILILILLFIYSCRDNKPENNLTINVRSEISSTPKELALSDFGAKIEYIKLKPKPDVSFRHIQKLQLTDKGIYLSDRKGLYLFDFQGEFVNEIGRMGNGPGEHSGNIRFAVNESAKEIYIYNFLKNIMVYDKETGLFLRDFPVEYNVCEILVPQPDRIVLFTWDTDRVVNPYEVIVMDTLGNILAAIANNSRAEIAGNVSAYATAWQYKDILRYLYIYSDSLFTIDENFERQIYASLKFENSVSRSQLSVLPEIVNHPDLLTVSRVTENEQYLFLWVQKGIHGGIKQDISYMLFDKHTNNLNKVSQIKNDLDGGMDFWPHWISNEIMIDYRHAFELLDYLHESQKKGIELSSGFLRFASTLNENDNPVLIMVR